MKVIFNNDNGKIIHGDNIDVLSELNESSVDSCISDFPYAIGFMGKVWDSGKHFYEWCYSRAVELLRVMKPGGYVAIFGHPKTNHRMKCAFEDAGFTLVEEIDWIYSTGFPKNQDIGKMFDKNLGVEREIVGLYVCPDGIPRNYANYRNSTNFGVNRSGTHRDVVKAKTITAPSSEEAKKWDGWKTAGLKPAHEPITIFQKPLEGTYIQNVEKYHCGAMNIDACRVPFQDEKDIQTAKAKTNFTEASDHSRGFGNGTDIYGDGNTPLEQAKCCIKDSGRFPPNVILDESTAEILDKQTGINKSAGGSGELSRIGRARHIYGAYQDRTNTNYINDSLGGYGDIGGGSRYFPIIKYCPKVAPHERQLSNGERNPHVTVKPVELIEWLIKLLTPKGGLTIDITAGSCTHAVACEKLNYEQNYDLKWVDIELMNTESEPYCNVGKQRVEAVNSGKAKKLF